jgi:hypothetical protein
VTAQSAVRDRGLHTTQVAEPDALFQSDKRVAFTLLLVQNPGSTVQSKKANSFQEEPDAESCEENDNEERGRDASACADERRKS